MLGWLLIAVFVGGVAAYIFVPAFRAKVDGYKTMFMAAMVAALGALQTADLTSLFSDPKVAGVAVIVIGVLIAVMRTMTNKPLGG